MNWQCRLYGHQWRHPGTPEVVIANGVDPTYPIECDVCGSQQFLTSDGVRIPDIRDERPTTESELDPSVEVDGMDDSSDA